MTVRSAPVEVVGASPSYPYCWLQPGRAKYVPDFMGFDKIVVEIKAVVVLADLHRAQLQNYLKATGYKLGLLVNFGHYPKLEYERIVK